MTVNITPHRYWDPDGNMYMQGLSAYEDGKLIVDMAFSPPIPVPWRYQFRCKGRFTEDTRFVSVELKGPHWWNRWYSAGTITGFDQKDTPIWE